jgi:uncharacterized protein YjdB
MFGGDKMKRKNIFKSLLAAAMALTMIFGAAPLSGFVGIRLPMLSLKAEAAITGTTEDGLFEYEVEGYWPISDPRNGVRITRYKGPDSGEVVIPKTIGGYEVKKISDGAFQNCTGITSIVIPDSVISIGGSTFSGCTSLAEIVIPDSVTSIGGYAFSYCTSLTEIVIPDSVTTIGESAFSGCASLAEIVVPDSVTEIGEYAFSGCTSLSKVKLPKNLTGINWGVFSDCTSLAEITVSPDNKNYSSVDGVLFNKDGSELIIYPKGNGRSAYTVPDGVTSISGSAFSGCTSLTEIVIPDSVTTIGKSAFSGCTSLSKVDLPKKLTTIEAYTFSGCSSLESIVIPEGVTAIGTWLEYEKTYYSSSFSGCKSLKEIIIPDSVTAIGDSAFYGCTSLSKVKLSNTLRIIQERTFSGCTSLKEIVIPDSVTAIYYEAFSNCISLESITIGSGVESLGDEWIASCRRLENITVSPENKTYSSVDGVLFNKDKSELSAYPIGNKRSSYTIPDGVEKIGKKAFYGCRYIESLTIPVSVAEIEASALGNCYDIRAVYYLGTREQWKEVVIGADNYMFALVNVRCADDSQCRHVWGEWEVVEEATYEKDGLERRVCSLCKAEQTRKIPRLGAVKVDAIELSDSEKKLNVGKSFTITATVKPDNAWNRTVTWRSSDPSIATVDENGTVTAIAEGEAIITAESADGVKAECKVTVEKKESFGKKLLNVITAPFRAIINLFKKLFGK